MRHATRSFQHGLSLVESMVTLGVVAGALQLGLPALDDMLQASALSSASQDLLVDPLTHCK